MSFFKRSGILSDLWKVSLACLAIKGTCASFGSVVLYKTHPPSCVPLLHAHYRHFIASMNALTPALRLFGTF